MKRVTGIGGMFFKANEQHHSSRLRTAAYHFELKPESVPASHPTPLKIYAIDAAL